MREWIERTTGLRISTRWLLQPASSPEEEQELIESADLLLEDGFEAEFSTG